MHRFVRRVRDGHANERGFFMVWMAITFVTLTAFAGLALEFSRWNNLGTRIQKAADAAALAGAVFMPENIANKAFITAKSISSQNGFAHGVKGVTVITAPGTRPNQLKVTISVPTKNPWGKIVGYADSTVVRSAVAEYQLPQNLGSPENRYGNDPEAGGVQPQFWGNVFGPSSPKGNGDAFQGAGPAPAAASLCSGSTDNCIGSPATNKDYDQYGYFYGIDVPAGATGALNVQIFDPGFVHVGDNCTDGAAVNSLNNAATLAAGDIPGYSGPITPAVRYASGSGSAYCTGDMYYPDSNTLPPWTTWTLRGPDVSAWDPTNNPILCQAEFPGIYPERANDLPGGTVDANRLKTLLQQSTTYPGTNPARTFATFFRQWVEICSVANPAQGTYFLEVQTNKKIDGTAAPNGGGANRYAAKVGLGTNFTATNGIRLYGNQKMGIYANASGADTRFYLTRVLPGQAGNTLILQFFDTGDASQAGDISVLPPPESNVAGGLFANCKYTKPPGNSTGPPWGTLINTASGCKITGVSSGGGYNGQWVTYSVPIPPDYTCDDTIATGCWTRLRFSYPAGTTVNDTTAWMAYMLGDPVRLIQ